MQHSNYWAEHAGESASCVTPQGIAMLPWYFLYWSEEHQGLRPLDPLEAEITPWAGTALCHLEPAEQPARIDVPLMSIEDWSDFIRRRSAVDQKMMTQVITRVLLTARMMDRTCQIMYRGIKKYRKDDEDT